MSAHKRFTSITPIVVLAAVLLLTPRALAAGAIPFVEHTIDGNFDGAYSVYAADVDGDGDIDVLGAASYADDITWWENDGDENFTGHTITDNFDGAMSVYATDVDGDGDVDILGAAYEADDIAWWENDGDENFVEHTIAGNFNGAYSVYAADMDSDGDVDILGAAIVAHDVTWWENDGNENFTEHIITDNFYGADSVYPTDMDGDGDMDVLGAAWGPVGFTSRAGIYWWENDGSENFTEHIIAGYYTFQNAREVYATDMDGDGDVDVLGAARASGISWWENDGSENFTKRTVVGPATMLSVYGTDVDNDGDVDIIGANDNAGYISWWENDGSENFTEHSIVYNFLYACSVYATDVDRDGDVDVLGAARDANDITWCEQLSRISINDVSVTEGDSGSVSAVFSATLSITSTQMITVEYATADGSAVAPSDYTAIPTATLVFPPGVPTRLITVSVHGDTVDEPDETFWVNLANPVNAVLSDTQGQGVILDDDLPTISFSSAAYSATEDAGQAIITVTLSAAFGPTVTVDYVAGDGSAISGVGKGWTYTLQEDVTSTFSSPATRYVGPNMFRDVIGQVAGTYYYRVRASSTLGDSGWSNVRSVLVGPPDTPVLNPIDNPDGNGSYAVNWVQATGTSTYTLEEDDNEDFSSPVTVYSGPGTSKYISGRDLGTYWYRVNASNVMGSSGWSNYEPVTVTVTCSPTPGSWSGTGSYPASSVSFAVSSDSSMVTRFGMSWSYPGACGHSSFNYVLSRLIDQNCHFYGSTTIGSATFSWTGDFSSSSAAAGTWRVTDGMCSANGTWWATGPSYRAKTDHSMVNGDRNPVELANLQSPGAPALLPISNPDRDGDYTVNWTGGDYAAVSGTLTFAPGEITYTFTVPIADDALDEADETVHLALGDPVNADLGAPTTATLTIVDDDPPPTVQLSSAAYSADEGSGTATITATLSAASGLTVTVHYTASNGTAEQPDDYTAVSGTLTFAPGQTIYTFTVPIADDALDEVDETVHLALSDPANANPGVPATATLTIVDDDPPPTAQLSSATYSVDEGAGTATITATLSAVSGLTVTVHYTASDGTATQPGDYTAVSGTLTFAPGQTVRTLAVPIADDALDEADETVHLALSDPVNADPGAPATATLTIVDDDVPVVHFSATSYSIVEAEGVAVITVTLDIASWQTVTVGYDTSDGTATGGQDYITASGTLTFTPGITAQTFTVAINDDTLVEVDETILLALSNPTNGTLLVPEFAILTILDDDVLTVPVIEFSSPVYDVDEGDGSTTITVTLDVAHALTLSVDYATTDGTATAGSDYITASGTLTFTPGITLQTFVVSILDDALDESDETVTLTLSHPVGGDLGQVNPATLTIVDDDGQPSVRFSAASYAIVEAAGSAAITVTLSNPYSLTVTVDYTTTDGTATAGSDYLTASGTLTFTPGTMAQAFAVPILDDALYESDETVALALSHPTNATLGASNATLTIADDEVPPTVAFSGATYDVGEGAGVATITVTLDATTALTTTVEYATSDGTATSDDDYTAASGALVFTPGVLAQTFDVPILDDDLDEVSETITLTLSNPINATLGDPASATLVIVDDDGLFSIYLPLVLRDWPLILEPPILSAISNPDGDGSYTVSWSEVNLAHAYTLQEDNNSAFSSPSTAYSGTDTSASISGKGLGIYYYRVRAAHPSGGSDWSAPQAVTVTVGPPSGCPQLGPWAGTTSQDFAISFTVAVTGTSSCQVQDGTIKFLLYCPRCRLTFTSPFRSALISDDHFDTGSAFPRVYGDFTSGVESNGNWYASFTDPACGLCEGAGTWTAAYTNTVRSVAPIFQVADLCLEAQPSEVLPSLLKLVSSD